MLRRFYAVTGVVEPISASRRHFRRQSAISGAEIDVVARSVTHSAIVASADGERESKQFSPPFCSFPQSTEEEKTRDPDLSPTTTTFFLAERGGV